MGIKKNYLLIVSFLGLIIGLIIVASLETFRIVWFLWLIWPISLSIIFILIFYNFYILFKNINKR